ncbi:MAG: DUF1579 family protein [Burkholderiaceae bacterium]
MNKSLVAIMLYVLVLSVTNIKLAHAQTGQTKDSLPASARLALPGEKHKWLEPLVGNWNVEMKVWPAMGAKPIVSTELKVARQWILGGRYLREELTGSFAGNPSNRIAILSFNNLDDRFELVTIDTFEPGQMWYRSVLAASPSRIALQGESTEAGNGPKPTGRKRDLRFEIEIESPQVNSQKIYVKYPGEPEFLFVEQRFTKAK